MDSIKRQARLAGILYTLVAITAPIGLLYVSENLFVPGDATATADHMRASEWLLRLGIGTELLHQAIQVFLVLVLYELFKPVSKSLAAQVALLGFIPIPMVFLNVLNEIAALILVSGSSFLMAFSKPQLDSLAMFFIGLHDQGLQVAGIFWGLWLFPFGLLVVRCGFIPKAFGVLLIFAGAGYLAESFLSLLLPHHPGALGEITSILELGEPPIILWLLIWGARKPPSPAQIPEVNP